MLPLGGTIAESTPSPGQKPWRSWNSPIGRLSAGCRSAGRPLHHHRALPCIQQRCTPGAYTGGKALPGTCP